MSAAGDLLRTAREARGLTQAALAERAGTAQSAVSRLECGVVSPTVETLERLLEAADARLILIYQPKETQCHA